ncbi:hypothetical protein OIY81_1696 [Cryptosporidium canis]|uniref:Uncharacterized protein n=1 Tax=Cryptosporidium canis TaxID=195482 RepID=A0ABQ8P491_9CRYT|nr:hypothetical protein OJ252_2915 [Cryptosporidium canis]KAJ1611408.1 hypothetical protein OIY81_1696 [Cryptosporidium canis]
MGVITVEGDSGIVKQVSSCLSCLLRGFKCQDVLVRVTEGGLMLYSFPLGGFSSCFQFNFDGRVFDRFDTGGVTEFERLYKVSSLLNCFNNIQWLKANRFVLETEGHNDDALRVTLHGRNGIVRRHRVYPVIGSQDRILMHEKILWRRRHGIRVSSGLLKDIFGYMEVKESKMTLSISPQESQISIKVQPIASFGHDAPTASSSSGVGGSSGSNISNSSTYQDIQIKNEQIETLSLCESIMENSSFTFNSREFKVAIALAESCQLPVFLTMRAPGSPMIVSIGQRAIIDQMCTADLDGNSIPFEYHWEHPLFQSQLFEIDNEYIEKTQIVSGFSAIFLLSTFMNPDSTIPDPITSFNSPNESQDQPLEEAPIPMVISQEQRPACPGTDPSRATRGVSPEVCKPEPEPEQTGCSFSRLDSFDLRSLLRRLRIEETTCPPDLDDHGRPHLEIPPKDQGVKSFDWACVPRSDSKSQDQEVNIVLTRRSATVAGIPESRIIGGDGSGALVLCRRFTPHSGRILASMEAELAAVPPTLAEA